MNETSGRDLFCYIEDHIPEPCPFCDALARARADEREQVGRVWAKREDLLLGDIEAARADERAALNGKLLRLYTQNTHAEAVAARLVEVICEQDDLIQIVGVDATNHRAAAADMRRERDAARAESERLGRIVREQDEHATWMRQCWKAVAEERDEARADAIVATRERDAARAEVAALQVFAQDANEAFASGRREVLADLRAKLESGWAPELDHEARIAVLALLDEAGQ